MLLNVVLSIGGNETNGPRIPSNARARPFMIRISTISISATVIGFVTKRPLFPVGERVVA